MGSGYYQFCPVAKAMELLDERWTLLIVLKLVCGSQQFNELRRGLPRMSPSLLSKRLQQLARAGIVERKDRRQRRAIRPDPGGVGNSGRWSRLWAFGASVGSVNSATRISIRICCSWDMHRNIDHAAVPDGRTVVQFRFPDVPAKA